MSDTRQRIRGEIEKELSKAEWLSQEDYEQVLDTLTTLVLRHGDEERMNYCPNCGHDLKGAAASATGCTCYAGLCFIHSPKTIPSTGGCLWDSIPADANGNKVAGIACPCPKHSVTS